MLFPIGTIVYYKNETYKVLEDTGRTGEHNGRIIKIVSLRTNEIMNVVEYLLDTPPIRVGNMMMV